MMYPLMTRVILILLTILTVSVKAVDYYMLTDLGSSAEMIGYGNVEGFGKSANNVFENPAGLARISHGSMALFYTQIMGEANYFNASIGTKTRYGTLAAGYMEVSVGNIPFLGESGFVDDQGRFSTNQFFGSKNNIVKGSYQYQVRDFLSLGLSAVRYSNSFHQVRGVGYNADAGALLMFENLEVSLSARNIIPVLDVEYNEDASEDLPLQLTAGAKYHVWDLDLLLQVRRQSGLSLTSGGVRYSPSQLPYLALSLGAKQFQALDGVKDTVVFGVALKLQGIEFHYAYEKSDHFEFDNKNYFSFHFNF